MRVGMTFPLSGPALTVTPSAPQPVNKTCLSVSPGGPSATMILPPPPGRLFLMFENCAGHAPRL